MTLVFKSICFQGNGCFQGSYEGNPTFQICYNIVGPFANEIENNVERPILSRVLVRLANELEHAVEVIIHSSPLNMLINETEEIGEGQLPTFQQTSFQPAPTFQAKSNFKSIVFVRYMNRFANETEHTVENSFLVRGLYYYVSEIEHIIENILMVRARLIIQNEIEHTIEIFNYIRKRIFVFANDIVSTLELLASSTFQQTSFQPFPTFQAKAKGVLFVRYMNRFSNDVIHTIENIIPVRYRNSITAETEHIVETTQMTRGKYAYVSEFIHTIENIIPVRYRNVLIPEIENIRAKLYAFQQTSFQSFPTFQGDGTEIIFVRTMNRFANEVESIVENMTYRRGRFAWISEFEHVIDAFKNVFGKGPPRVKYCDCYIIRRACNAFIPKRSANTYVVPREAELDLG